MNKYICVHGHFYQPPRENPWTNRIEAQPSAAPFHDWNERITEECYRSNAESKILGEDGKIEKVVNNYAKISFNFGPTLFNWLEKEAIDVYRKILDADKESQKQFGGHGSALAQCYNHMIMPLANERDKKTQVIWGIKDFEYHFGRKPEGMWLPETAVDVETLDYMAECGIRFVILAPHQAKAISKIEEEGRWRPIHKEKVNTQCPYVCDLPSGKTITIFFYNGSIAHDVAFGNLLTNGENFAKRLVSELSDDKEPRLSHIATDGETYGHHHRFGNMALAYMLEAIEKNKLAKLTVYGEFLDLCPPKYKVLIHENTSWSCFHGIERWRWDCGCCLQPKEGWNQKWRRGLRQALDWLRDVNIYLFEREMEKLSQDPWVLRDHYIEVILHNEEAHRRAFINRHFQTQLSDSDAQKVMNLLETQKQAMLMYTSCGWFFDDIGGLEVRQILQYAARLIELVKKTLSIDLEKNFLHILKTAKSNDPHIKHGEHVYREVLESSLVKTSS